MGPLKLDLQFNKVPRANDVRQCITGVRQLYIIANIK